MKSFPVQPTLCKLYALARVTRAYLNNNYVGLCWDTNHVVYRLVTGGLT